LTGSVADELEEDGVVAPVGHPDPDLDRDRRLGTSAPWGPVLRCATGSSRRPAQIDATSGAVVGVEALQRWLLRGAPHAAADLSAFVLNPSAAGPLLGVDVASS